MNQSNDRIIEDKDKNWILYHPCESDPNFLIVPKNDIRGHDIQSDCWCEPKISFENGKRIITHDAKDGRK